MDRTDRIEAKLDRLISSRRMDLSYEAIALIVILAVMAGMWSAYIMSKIQNNEDDEDDGLWKLLLITLIGVIIAIYILQRERKGI